MKTYFTKIHLLLFWLFCLFLTVGCSENDDVIEEVNTNPLNLESTANPVVLDIKNMDEEIVAFMWEAAPDKSNEGSTLEEYLFRMDIANNNFETSIPTTTVREGLFYKNFTTRTLSRLISEVWNINLGDEVSLDIRVIARYSNPDKFIPPLVSTITVPIHTKELSGHPLYLLGSATSSGDNPENAISMTELQRGEIYNWRGTLEPGDFYFILSPESLYPAYKQGNSKDEIIYIDSDLSIAADFNIEEAGTYSILVNLTSRRITCEEVIPYEITLNGTGSDYGWTDVDGRLTCNPYFPHEWSITAELKSGQIRFNASNMDSGNFAYRPLYPNTHVTEPIQDVILMSKPDYRWQVRNEDAGTYHIILDTKNNQIKFNKLY